MQGKLFAIVGVQQEYVLKENEKDVTVFGRFFSLTLSDFHH